MFTLFSDPIMASAAQIKANSAAAQVIVLDPVMSISSTAVEPELSSKPASQTPGKQVALKLPVAKRVRLTVPQAKALATETREMMSGVAIQHKADFVNSAEYLGEKQRFMETNQVCVDITKMLKAFNKYDLSAINRGMKSAYDSNEIRTYYGDLSMPDVTGRMNSLVDAHLLRHFEKELKELNLTIPSFDTVFNRILVNTIALNTVTELVTFQHQLINDLSPRIGDYLARHSTASLTVAA